MNGLKKVEKIKQFEVQQQLENEVANEGGDEVEESEIEPKKSIFEKWTDKFRDFLDNAE